MERVRFSLGTRNILVGYSPICPIGTSVCRSARRGADGGVPAQLLSLGPVIDPEATIW
jgi:hypothetical protein